MKINEKKSVVLRYEKNLAALPFFSQDRSISRGIGKTYIFSEKENKYMRVIPDNDPTKISNKIPQEFDEKVFFGILKLAEMQNSNTVTTNYFEIAANSYVSCNNIKRIKDSVERLHGTRFEFYNAFFLAANGICEKISFSLLESFSSVRNRNRDIITVRIAEPIYKNLQTGLCIDKFPYGSDWMFRLTAAERKLYLLILLIEEKAEKAQENSFRVSCESIASRFPLSWEDANIKGSLNCLVTAASWLHLSHFITCKLIKTKPLANSYFIFYF